MSAVLKAFFAAFLVCGGFICAFADGSFYAPSSEKLGALGESFRSKLADCGASGGALCVVANGKVLYGRDFDFPNGAVSGAKPNGAEAPRRYPLGNTSQVLLSLMLAAMQRDGILAADWRVSRHCSYFKFGSGDVTFDDLLSMRGGFDSHSDSLVPADASSLEVFEIARQIPPAGAAKTYFARSRLSAALAGYAMGYVFDKKTSNMKKSFAACAKRYLFEPMKFEDPRFVSFDTALFPATAFALSVVDCAAWLCCETSPNPPVAPRSEIAARRLSRDAADRFGGGWLASNEGVAHFFVSADYWQNCANVVAVFPDSNFAAAFFARSSDAQKASKACADSLSEFISILTNRK